MKHIKDLIKPSVQEVYDFYLSTGKIEEDTLLMRCLRSENCKVKITKTKVQVISDTLSRSLEDEYYFHDFTRIRNEIYILSAIGYSEKYSYPIYCLFRLTEKSHWKIPISDNHLNLYKTVVSRFKDKSPIEIKNYFLL